MMLPVNVVSPVGKVQKTNTKQREQDRKKATIYKTKGKHPVNDSPQKDDYFQPEETLFDQSV